MKTIKEKQDIEICKFCGQEKKLIKAILFQRTFI